MKIKIILFSLFVILSPFALGGEKDCNELLLNLGQANSLPSEETPSKWGSFALRVKQHFHLDFKVAPRFAQLKLTEESLEIPLEIYENFSIEYAEKLFLKALRGKLETYSFSYESPEELELLIGYLRFQGFEIKVGENYDLSQKKGDWIEFLPISNGKSLNRLAYWAKRFYGISVIYNPDHMLKIGARGYANSREISISKEEVLGGSLDEDYVWLHELRHAQSDRNLARGIPSFFYGYFRGRPMNSRPNSQRYSILKKGLGSKHYVDFQDLSEVPNHIRDLKRMSYLLKKLRITLPEGSQDSFDIESRPILKTVIRKILITQGLLKQSYLVFKNIQDKSAAYSDFQYELSPNGHLNIFTYNIRHSVEWDVFLPSRIIGKLKGKDGDDIDKIFDSFAMSHIPRMLNILEKLMEKTSKVEVKFLMAGEERFSLRSLHSFYEEVKELVRVLEEGDHF